MKTMKLFAVIMLTALSMNLSAQLKVMSDGSSYMKGHVYLYANEGDGSSGTAYLQARDFSGTSNVGLTLRTQDNGSTVDALSISDLGIVRIKTNDYSIIPLSLVTYSNTTYQKNYLVIDRSTLQHKFWVNGNGNAYSGGYYSTSDKNLKEDIADLSGAIDKLKQIRGVTYKFKEPAIVNTSSDQEGLDKKTPEQGYEELTKEQQEALKYNEGKKRAGVFAQDVEKVLPEAVRMMDDGSKAVCYDDLIPLLIEAIKEQNSEIEKLKSGTKLKSSYDFESVNSTGEAILGQNKPNPFSENTTIEFYLPQEVASANLYIYDLQGKQIKNYSITQRENGSVIINASELLPGMYKYALIADRQIIGTETMILTD